jgi:hypothetical protein
MLCLACPSGTDRPLWPGGFIGRVLNGSRPSLHTCSPRQSRGPLAEAFAATRGAMGYDAPLMSFMLPYVVRAFLGGCRVVKGVVNCWSNQ